MAIQYMTEVFKNTNLKPSAKIVLLAMADNADDFGRLYPSVKTIAKKAGLSYRQTQKVMRDLEADGYFHTNKRTRENGSQRSSEYVFCNLEDIAKTFDENGGCQNNTPCHPRHHPPVASDTTPLSPTTPLSLSPTTPLEPSLEPSPEPSLEPSLLFDQFWERYPKKAGKPPAKKAFAKLIKDQETLDRVLHSIDQHLEQGAWDLSEKQFIPHPATWLNRHGWEDEIVPRNGKKNEFSSQATFDRTQKMIDGMKQTNSVFGELTHE